MRHIYAKRNVNCEIHDCPVNPHGILGAAKFEKRHRFFLLSHMWGEACYDVHKALYQICEIYDPWVRGSDARMGSILPYSKIALI